MLLALVKRPPYSNLEHSRELVYSLEVQGIKARLVHDVADIHDDHSELYLHNPTVYFRDPSIRIERVKELAEWLAGRPEVPIVVSSSGEIVGLHLGKALSLGHDFLYDRKIQPFFLHNISTYWAKSLAEQPLGILYTQMRGTYLKLSLNSMAAASDVSDYPLVVVINGHTPEYEAVVRECLATSGFRNVRLLKTRENAYNSSINLALQWFKPKTFSILEDDFLIPQTVRDFFPDWPRRFAEKLSFVDLVGWGTSANNAPKNFYEYAAGPGNTGLTRFRAPNGASQAPHTSWLTSWNEKPLVGAHGLTMTTDFYKTVAVSRPQDFSPCDSDLQTRANGMISPAILGYHIGWNQEADGYGALARPGRWRACPVKNELEDLDSGEKREFELSGILS